jgi:hypothetical protein
MWIVVQTGSAYDKPVICYCSDPMKKEDADEYIKEVRDSYKRCGTEREATAYLLELK